MTNDRKLTPEAEESVFFGPLQAAKGATEPRQGTLMPKPGPKGPIVYTREKVAALTRSLETYFDASDALYFESWAVTEGLHMRQVRRIAEANPDFAEVFDRCGCIQASRLLEGSTRPADTTTNQVRYNVNPKMACLVLQTKHDYKTQQEIAVEVSADRGMPASAEDTDRMIEKLQEHRLMLAEMVEQANLVETGIVDQ